MEQVNSSPKKTFPIQQITTKEWLHFLPGENKQ